MLSVSWTEEKRNEDILRTANGKDHVQYVLVLQAGDHLPINLQDLVL